ncbi:MAG: hypothetical protein JNM67_02180, partial [Bacteroidetes bacterium]|nr:hypothetical protein [Bacteroidota bacterium]
MIVNTAQAHQFHIPVMGLGFTIDTPFKLSHLGINSAVSVMEDDLLEKMRAHYSKIYNRSYSPIDKSEFDARALRVKAYIELMHEVTESLFKQGVDQICGNSEFESKYMELLPDNSPLLQLYKTYLNNPDNKELLEHVKSKMYKGRIELNIMTKIDRPAYNNKGIELSPEFSDAKAALRGIAESAADVSIVFSAGFNPGLYTYCEKFLDFYPDKNGKQRKQIVLKVSDYRSARVQGLFFAKKGIWVSEFRIESGLNCGGHAFVSEGTLMGPVLQEFKDKRQQLLEELFQTCQTALQNKGFKLFKEQPALRITAQGGIGNSEENELLLKFYNLDSCGWGSPFLLVPEATSVDDSTLEKLIKAQQEDYYLSHASPLGVPFNNLRGSSSDTQRRKRIEAGKPGSPCYKKFLSFNTEFTDKPICTASRQYQHKKIQKIREEYGNTAIADRKVESVLEKDCLCEGLGSSALQVHGISHDYGLDAVAICPGPNLAYFSGVFTLQQMCSHIYGKINILNQINRPHMFINELKLNIDYWVQHIKNKIDEEQNTALFEKYRSNLLKGIEYYLSVYKDLKVYMQSNNEAFLNQLD